MLEAKNFVPLCKFEAATAAAVAACDGIDGVKDGVLEDPRRCTYDPKALVGTSPNRVRRDHGGRRRGDQKDLGRAEAERRIVPLVRSAARRGLRA